MKRSLVLIALFLALVLCFAACDISGKEPADTTATPTTQETTQELTQEPTTEAPTTEEPTTEETTEAKNEIPEPTADELKAAAVAYIDAEKMLAAANNPQQDWSDFGGLTVNEDGSVTALFRMGTNDVWDPYCYLIKEPTAVGDIMVIQYKIQYDFRVRLFLGTEGDHATGAGDNVTVEFYATEGDEWGYLVMNLREEAAAYDSQEAALGYLRLGLDMAESGDTVTIGYIAFFHTMDEVNALIPY